MKLEMPFQEARILVVGDVMLDRYWQAVRPNFAGSAGTRCRGCQSGRPPRRAGNVV